MFKASEAALARMGDLPEWADPGLLAREGWPAWSEAVATAHRPEGLQGLAATSPARQRLAYDEVLAHQLTGLGPGKAQTRVGPHHQSSGVLQAKVLDALPYAPTGAQTRAIGEITADMAAPQRMNRLLQGDVGAGKTLVAFQALLTAVEAGGQGVLMAPTEILARQHMESLEPLALALRSAVGDCSPGATRRRAAREIGGVGRGRYPSVDRHPRGVSRRRALCRSSLAVIDEQHRFGVRQRLALGEKGLGGCLGDDGHAHSSVAIADAIWGHGVSNH